MGRAQRQKEVLGAEQRLVSRVEPLVDPLQRHVGVRVGEARVVLEAVCLNIIIVFVCRSR